MDGIIKFIIWYEYDTNAHIFVLCERFFIYLCLMDLLQEDTISINHNWFNGYNLSWVVSNKQINQKQFINVLFLSFTCYCTFSGIFFWKITKKLQSILKISKTFVMILKDFVNEILQLIQVGSYFSD